MSEKEPFIRKVIEKGTNLTQTTVAGVNNQAGKKGPQSKRQKTVPKVAKKQNQRATAKPKNSSVRVCAKDIFTSTPITSSPSGSTLKVKITKRPKYIPTLTTPFEFIGIWGNVRVCAGCRQPLKDRPTTMKEHEVLEGDSIYCVRHRENDHVLVEGAYKATFDNKHYHVWMKCLKKRNPGFDLGALQVELEDTSEKVVIDLLDRLRS